MLARVADRAVGLDWDEEALQTARVSAPVSSRLGFERWDLTVDLPPCDWIVSLETIEHLPDYDSFLALLQERAQGGVVLSTPILSILHRRPGHHRSVTPEEIDGWFAGWTKHFHTYLYEPWRDNSHYPMYYLGVYSRHPTHGGLPCVCSG